MPAITLSNGEVIDITVRVTDKYSKELKKSSDTVGKFGEEVEKSSLKTDKEEVASIVEAYRLKHKAEVQQ